MKINIIVNYLSKIVDNFSTKWDLTIICFTIEIGFYIS